MCEMDDNTPFREVDLFLYTHLIIIIIIVGSHITLVSVILDSPGVPVLIPRLSMAAFTEFHHFK